LLRDTTEQRKEKTRNKTMTSEHCCQLGLKQEQEEENKEETEKEEVEESKEEEEPWDQCEGSFPGTCYPTPPRLEEQVPDDLPREENEELPAEDEWHCPVCKNSPCLFIQYQDELERHVDIMYPEVRNNQKHS
jgi:hypothetical protein